MAKKKKIVFILPLQSLQLLFLLHGLFQLIGPDREDQGHGLSRNSNT